LLKVKVISFDVLPGLLVTTDDGDGFIDFVDIMTIIKLR